MSAWGYNNKRVVGRFTVARLTYPCKWQFAVLNGQNIMCGYTFHRINDKMLDTNVLCMHVYVSIGATTPLHCPNYICTYCTHIHTCIWVKHWLVERLTDFQYVECAPFVIVSASYFNTITATNTSKWRLLTDLIVCKLTATIDCFKD